jgi:glycosyltransferase involved in cell wall biosynthesis
VKKNITILTPCFNEAENVRPLYEAIKSIMAALPDYDYSHLYIDNASNDGSEIILRQLASEDKHVKVIFNARNFGHIRSPFYGLLQADGDAVIYMASDFQDPPDMIPRFISEWEKGAKAVLAIKDSSDESGVFFALRKLYYRLVERLADVRTFQNFTGFGLYDRQVVDYCRSPRTTSTRSTTWRCWGSPTIPRSPYGLPRCPASSCR